MCGRIWIKTGVDLAPFLAKDEVSQSDRDLLVMFKFRQARDAVENLSKRYNPNPCSADCTCQHVCPDTKIIRGPRRGCKTLSKSVAARSPLMINSVQRKTICRFGGLVQRPKT